ncbi:conserved hypothetical membrane protein [Thermoplasma acidophilum]|uniref:Conserved hypothetical membrane protein n=1 Tax=Thermoplasma acidophilum (strain ATCC 25905 / DSM 1728 / JCM 9062 / NBRC 15155 / AMRC-C165) TaxID=273075 RepID=Q9HKS4_THEAC|nr:conserved hypothetical membrane protein [Thermoplasma acidophilum]
MLLAIFSGFGDLKIPLPTNTPSAPSSIISAPSAGVATPPAAKLTTGNLPILRICLSMANISRSILLLPMPAYAESYESFPSTPMRSFEASSRSTKYDADIFEATARSCSSLILLSTDISSFTFLICLTASMMFPVPASPFVLIIAAPSNILRTASGRFLAPETTGTVRFFL